MKFDKDYAPDFDSLRDLVLDMAQERSVDGLLQLIVKRLATRPHVALAHIWLIGPGDLCGTCPPVMEDECSDQSECLHLVASAGNPRDESGDWSSLDGDFRRFPIGGGIVGQIAATGEPVLVTDLDHDTQWVTRPEWTDSEGIRGYGGQPLVYQGDTLGAIVVFLRVRPEQEGMAWLRLIADHAATAIANARAFQEIERLKGQLELERDYLREEVREAHAFGEIVGSSAALENVIQQIELVAPTDASVLVLGDSGTGKELVAREIHKRSSRRDRPMIKVNCASVPRELYESEFFGHVKGAFTGALNDRVGRFELADGGTLFLDEVGEIPLSLQGKLLRVLQEGEFERIGSESTRACDVRIIAATNRGLKQEVQSGRFREDFYYRLNVFPIEVLPLRDHLEDVPLLAAHFLEQAASKFNRPRPRLTKANILALQQYPWPGNVRELQNVIERAVITSRSGGLRFDLSGDDTRPRLASTVSAADDSPRDSAPDEVLPDVEMKRRERENMLAALDSTGWRIYGPDGAAALLGIQPTTLSSRITRLRLKKTDSRTTHNDDGPI